MTRFADSFALWLGDFYLLSTVLLTLALIGIAALKQPAQRMAITKSTLVALALLAALCALPRWSVVHLLTAASQQQSQLSESPPLQFDANQPAHSVPAASPRVRTPDSVASVEPAPNTIAPALDWPSISWPAILAIVHLCGAIAAMVWLSVGSLAARGLRLSAIPAPAELTALLAEVAASRKDATTWPRLSETRKIDLLTSNAIDVPVALGIVRPAILLPNNLASPESAIRNPQSEIKLILAHELAHIRNNDLAWLAVSRGLLALLYAHPLYWLLRRRLRLDQESLADAAAAELTSRQHYAEQLMAWARNIGNRAALRPMSAVGLWEGQSQLCRRIEILIDEKLMIARQCPRHWRIAAAILAIAATLALSAVTIQPQRLAIARESTETKPAITAKSSKTAQQPAHLDETKLTPNTIAGHALDEKSEPVAGAEVFLFRVGMSDSSRNLIAQTKTDAKGTFQFNNVIDIEKEFPDKKFPSDFTVGDRLLQVVVKAPGRAAYTWMNAPGHVAKRGMNMRAVMFLAATLSGRITGWDGKPVAGALVTVGGNGSFGNWEGVNSALTDANGNYKIEDIREFDRAEYRKQLDEQIKRTGNVDTFVVNPPLLTVEAPSFATKLAALNKAPGEQDVRLERPVILEGRAVFADTGKPAADILVQASTMITARTAPQFSSSSDTPMFLRAAVHTDQDGNYRITTLPLRSYAIWADVPDWVTKGVITADPPSENPPRLPDLILTKGGIVSARIVDSKNSKPIPLEPDMRAMLIADSASSPPSGRAQTNHSAEANPEGRFELRVPAGKQSFLVGYVFSSDGTPRWAGHRRPEVDVVEGQTVEVDVPMEKYVPAPVTANDAFAVFKPTEAEEKEGNSESKGSDRTLTLLSYGDGKPDGKKRYGGSGHLIRFELPEGVTKVKGIRIHGSRYGLPQAPDEDFEITFLSDKRDEVLQTESAPYKLFKRGKENWVRVLFDKEVELPPKFWIALDFNAEQTKGVYVSYDTSTKGEYSRVGKPGDKEEPKKTDFDGDWMVQVMLSPPKSK